MPKATLINNAGQKVVVESGSQQAQQYFGQGYKLMGAPATPAPVVTENKPDPTPARTISDVAASLPDYTEDPFYSKIGAEYKTKAEETVDQEAIRKAARDRIQSEIDSINLAYNQKLATAKQQGIGRLGSVRATQARSGLLGSDFAAAQNNEIENYNTEILNTIEAERMAKISALTTQAEKDASAEIAEKRKAIEAGADKYLEFLGAQQERKQSKLGGLVQMMLDQGVDPTELTPEQLTKITSSYSTDLNTINSLYKNAQAAKTKADSEAAKTKLETEKLIQDIAKSKSEVKLAEEAAANKDKFFELSEGQTRYVYDPATGTAKVVATQPKTYKGGSGSGSGGGNGGGGGYGGSGDIYSNDLDALIANVGAGITALNQRNAFYSAIKGARNESDKLNTVAKVLNITGDSKTDLVNTAVGLTSLKQAINLLESGTKTGLVQAGKDYAFNLVGNQVSPELTQLKQLITASLQPYRSSVTGAAWGSQEEAEYRSMFGSIKDNPQTLLTKLKSLETIMSNKRVGIVQAFADPLGTSSAFNGLYGNDYGTPVTPTETPAASDTVKVKNPNTGQVGTIPAANLQKALEKGYIQVN